MSIHFLHARTDWRYRHDSIKITGTWYAVKNTQKLIPLKGDTKQICKHEITYGFQTQLQHETRDILVLGFGAAYVRDLTALSEILYVTPSSSWMDS